MKSLYAKMAVAVTVIAAAALAAWALNAAMVSGVLGPCSVSTYNLSIGGNLTLVVTGVELRIEDGPAASLRISACGPCKPVVEAHGDTVSIHVEQNLPLAPLCRVKAKLTAPRFKILRLEARGASITLEDIHADTLLINAAGAAIHGYAHVTRKLEVAASGASITLETRMPPNATGVVSASGASIVLTLDSDAKILLGAETSLAGASIATPGCRGETGPLVIVENALGASIVLKCRS